MAPIRYSLHYEDYSEHIMSRFGKLLQMQSLVDMTLMCSSHTLRVHKAVLAASSAYFQEVLQNQSGEPLIVLKMRFSVLKCLVEFMYCGKTQCLEENLDELVSAAHFLKIKGLSKVTKEGLGITTTSELPIFTPPVVVNRPPQAHIDGQILQEPKDPKTSPPLMPINNNTNMDKGRPNKDMVVRIPFDIDNGGGSGTPAGEYDAPRVIKPRRGRPSARRNATWEGGGGAGGALGRALLRREQDSRDAIHHLKHLQTRHLQDYMDRVTLSQAVSSICGPESTPSHNYMNLDNDLMYMEPPVPAGVLDHGSYGKESSLGPEPPAAYPRGTDSSNISTAMSQYVNALKSAGLPTDLPILFESGDGSYINVNEQVLLDMVQSSEIQYEVIEQPNIIEKVADPSEIKSIDELSKSIERGEMMLGSKGYSTDFDKQPSQYIQHTDTINSLNAILPDSLESFGEQQNYIVLDPPLQETSNPLDNVHANDFSCIDSDMQFFTKAMSDDVKKYYEEQHLNDSRTMAQLCPKGSSTNFSISLLDNKCDLSSNMNQQYSSVNHEDLRRHDDCYDFDLQLPQSTVFKDPLDCLMDTPKRNDGETSEYNERLEKNSQEREEIIKDLLKIEDNIMNETRSTEKSPILKSHENITSNENMNSSDPFKNEFIDRKEPNIEPQQSHQPIPSNDLHWDTLDLNKTCDTVKTSPRQTEIKLEENKIDSSDFPTVKTEKWTDLISENEETNKENVSPLDNTLINDIPFAVGLLPMKQVQPTETYSLLKRKNSADESLLEDLDAKCLKRKVKYKK